MTLYEKIVNEYDLTRKDKIIIRERLKDTTWKALGELLKEDSETVRSYARKQPWYPRISKPNPHSKLDLDEKVKRERKVAEDGSIVEDIEKHFREPTDPKTPADFMALHKYDPKEFVFISGESNVWTVTNAEGKTYYNVQSKIKVKPIAENELTIDEFIELLRLDPEPIKIEPVGIGERNLVIGLADLHFGVTDLEYLKTYLSEVIDVVMNGYDTIVIEQLGDLFHSSQMKESITLKGTILPTVDMVKAWHDAKAFYHTLIEHCAKYANKIQVEHAAGNHSGNLEYAFLDGIEERYSLSDINLTVNNHNEHRAVYRLGNVGIMISHGDTVGIKKLPARFADEHSLLWGETETREVHTGHKHNKFTEQEADNGVIMRQFPTPKPNDNWEVMKGYNSRKMIQLIEYDEDRSRVIYEI